MLTPGAPSTGETTDAAIVVHSGAAALRVNKNPLELELRDPAGNVVAQETAPIAWTDQTAADGAPIAQNGATIAWELPADEPVHGLGDKVGGGPGRDLLVAPKLVPGTDPYAVTLPQGAWWDTLTGDLNPDGGTVTITPPEDDSLRIFARGGAIIPSQPLTRMAGATPQRALTVEVWPGPDCSGALYLDDGRSATIPLIACRTL